MSKVVLFFGDTQGGKLIFTALVFVIYGRIARHTSEINVNVISIYYSCWSTISREYWCFYFNVLRVYELHNNADVELGAKSWGITVNSDDFSCQFSKTCLKDHLVM